ncbi:MAG: cytochrome c [Ilumatobacteraceae bacterium]
MRRPAVTTTSVDRTPSRQRAVACAGVALIVVLSGCGGESDDSAIDGAVLYQSNCASCHGADLEGTDRGPAHLSIVYEPGHHGDDSFRSAIANGAPQHHWTFGDMPAIVGLDEAEVTAIIAHIRSEQERQGLLP